MAGIGKADVTLPSNFLVIGNPSFLSDEPASAAGTRGWPIVGLPFTLGEVGGIEHR
jgi:hypothetical protein